MSIKCLTELQQDTVVILYTDSDNPLNQTEIAEYYEVSRRTIQRVLEARGLKSYNYGSNTPRVVHAVTTRPVQQPLDLQNTNPSRLKEDREIVESVRKRGLNPEALEKLLSAPRLTRGNVQVYLTKLPSQELANLVYTVGLVKLGELHQQNLRDAQKKEAANG